LIEYPAKTKLERLRQAAVPLAYQPEVDSERLFENLIMDGWNRVGTSSSRKPNGDKLTEQDDPGLSSDGAEVLEPRGRFSTTSQEVPSRVDRIRQRLNQIKLPDIRLRLGRRQASVTTANTPATANLTVNSVPKTNTDRLSSAQTLVPHDPARLVHEQQHPSAAPVQAKSNSQSESNRLLQGLTRFVQRPLAGATPSVDHGPIEPASCDRHSDQAQSDSSTCSDDGPRCIGSMAASHSPDETKVTNKPPEAPTLSDWSHSENELATGEESDRDRGYADDEDDSEDAVDEEEEEVEEDEEEDDEDDDDEAERDNSDDDERLVMVKKANLPPSTGKPSITVSQAKQLRVLHQRSLSEVYTIQPVDEQLPIDAETRLSKFGDAMSSVSGKIVRLNRTNHSPRLARKIQDARVGIGPKNI
uniref:DUF3835 domain-containing protein n=1 Tax=Echinostoma caproni TaxID=27848 RepID=A0A183B9P6_9TREM